MFAWPILPVHMIIALRQVVRIRGYPLPTHSIRGEPSAQFQFEGGVLNALSWTVTLRYLESLKYTLPYATLLDLPVLLKPKLALISSIFRITYFDPSSFVPLCIVTL